MTNEDKKIIADYMGWVFMPGENGHFYRKCPKNGSAFINLNLNDAGLVVQEMQKRGEFDSFDIHSFHRSRANGPKYVAWLFNADNFFNAFVEWRKTK